MRRLCARQAKVVAVTGRQGGSHSPTDHDSPVPSRRSHLCLITTRVRSRLPTPLAAAATKYGNADEATWLLTAHNS